MLLVKNDRIRKSVRAMEKSESRRNRIGGQMAGLYDLEETIGMYNYAHNKPIVCPFMKQSEVYLTGQNLTKSCSWPLDFCHTFEKGLDLSILKIWGLLVKGLQSYQLSKLEVTRKSLPTGPGPSQTSRPRFELYRGQIILKV